MPAGLPPRPDVGPPDPAHAAAGPGGVVGSLAASGFYVAEVGTSHVLASGPDGWGVWDTGTGTCLGWFAGHDPAWLLWNRLEHGGIPLWRQPRAVFIILHAVLALLVFPLLAAGLGAGIRAAFGHPGESEHPNGALLALGWLAPAAGWLLFVYLRRPLAQRISVGAILAAIGVLGWTLV